MLDCFTSGFLGLGGAWVRAIVGRSSSGLAGCRGRGDSEDCRKLLWPSCLECSSCPAPSAGAEGAFMYEVKCVISLDMVLLLTSCSFAEGLLGLWGD